MAVNFIFGIATIFTLTGCVTFKSPSVYDRKLVNIVPICVNLSFYYVHRPFGGSKVFEQLPNEYEGRLRRSLNSFGIQSHCADPIANLSLTIEENNNIHMLSGLWAASSFFTLGLIPFCHREKISLTIQEEETVLSEQVFEAVKIVSIIYIFKMISDDSKASDLFGINRRSDAEFSFVLSEEIRKAIQKKTNRESHANAI